MAQARVLVVEGSVRFECNVGEWSTVARLQWPRAEQA